MHVDVKGTRLWFDVEGPGLVPDGPEMRERPTVVLLHGGPGSFDPSYFKPDFARLSNVAQVVYLDLPGHGRSEWGDPASWGFEVTRARLQLRCRTGLLTRRCRDQPAPLATSMSVERLTGNRRSRLMPLN